MLRLVVLTLGLGLIRSWKTYLGMEANRRDMFLLRRRAWI
jgi:hypothetical protein